jgi:hypothetical protein
MKKGLQFCTQTSFALFNGDVILFQIERKKFSRLNTELFVRDQRSKLSDQRTLISVSKKTYIFKLHNVTKLASESSVLLFLPNF